MLPLAMTTGLLIYLSLHFLPCLRHLEGQYNDFAKTVQPVLVTLMLFLQFNVVSPSSMKVNKFFFLLLAIQGLLFISLGLVAAGLENGGFRLIVECAMLCFICPTAAAAGVITGKLGGSISEIMTYTILSNVLAATLIPMMVPFVNPSENASFMGYFLAVISRAFSILVLPCAAAWTIRYLLPGLHRWLETKTEWAFYFWGVGLCFAISIATKELILSGISVLLVIVIGLVTMAACLFQFWLGRRTGRSYGPTEEVTAGQALGQKNTGFIIWVGYSFLSPVTSIAGGFYSIWHNIVNTVELRRRQ